MLLAFPGEPTRWISVRILGADGAKTQRAAKVYAAEELARMTEPHLQQLLDAAHDGPAVHELAGVGLRNVVRQLEGDRLEWWDPALSG